MLAHNKTNTLLDGFKKKAQRKALEQLIVLGVEVEFNTRYKADNKVDTDEKSGKSVTPDMVFSATGTRPNNEFLTRHFSHILNSRGLVEVDKNLSMIGQSNFYALGDITDVSEAKPGYRAVEQGKYLGKASANEMKGTFTKEYNTNPHKEVLRQRERSNLLP